MNNLLEYFFEQFKHVERSSLYSRYRRRAMVEYFNTLIEGCRLGENCDVQKVVREAVINILRYHEQSRSQNGSVCMMGNYHNVLYVGLKLCYDWQLKDTETVATLLDEIYSCEKTFERLFVGALFGTRAPHFIAGWKSDFQSQEENVHAAMFFLDHATNANLEYISGHEDKPTRFIDVPIESCGKATCLKILLQLGIPDKLHMFLRFGARVYDDEGNESIVEVLLYRLNEFNHSYPYNLVACLQLILRVIPTIQVHCNKMLAIGQTCNQRDVILNRFPELVQDCLLPLSRCGFQPPELKHLCRCTIRHRLWNNYQLPNGIPTLPIPESLQSYIDIMED